MDILSQKMASGSRDFLDSTANIARRYRHAFRLPSARRTILYSSVPILLVAVFARVADSPSNALFWVTSLVFTELLFLFSTYVDSFILRRRSSIATFRRLAALNILPNWLWAVVSSSAFVFFFASLSSFQVKLFSIVIVGFFAAASFREIVIGAIFAKRQAEALFTAILQPLITLPAVLLVGQEQPVLISKLPLQSVLLSVVLGLLLLASTTAYVWFVNSAATSTTKGQLPQTYTPFFLFQSFMMAWAENDASDLEEIMERRSHKTTVRTQILSLADSHKDEGPWVEASLILPEIHPGPFYPVGSSNLPYDIYKNLKTTGLLPITLHSVSDHDLNLPSKREVTTYVASLKSKPSFVKQGRTASSFTSEVLNKGTVNGIAFEKSVVLLTLTLSPHGMEDFPPYVKERISTIGKECGFENVLTVDSHNSLGEKPTEADCNDVIEAAKRVLLRLKQASQHHLRLGFAHSSELENVQSRLGHDVGPAGIAVLAFADGEASSNAEEILVCVDGNNAAVGFREKVFEIFKKKYHRANEEPANSRIVEICTSDTHVTAAKALNVRGYLALGEATTPERMVETIEALLDKAKHRISESAFRFEIFESEPKTIGGKMLDDFSALLDKSLNRAKRGAVALLAFAILCFGIVLAFA